MSVGSQMPGGGLFGPPYKIGSQNTPYKLGIKFTVNSASEKISQTVTFVDNTYLKGY